MATLKESVKSLEDNIITISGPALAISGIIAGIDVLTSNVLKTYLPQASAILGVVWAICLMLTLDFQVLTLGVKSRHIYQSEKPGKQKLIEMGLAIIVASAIAYVSVQMGTIFARTLGTTMSIDQAEALLGIDPTALYYERSAMVMLLIFMSGWLRDGNEQPQSATQTTVAPTDEELRTAITEAVKSEVQAIAQSLSSQVRNEIHVLVQSAQVTPPAQPTTQITEMRTVDERPSIAQHTTQTTDPALPIAQPMIAAQEESDERTRVRSYCAAYQGEHGRMPTLEKIMDVCAVAKNTAVKHRRELVEAR
jgi:hypothetical protein